MIVETIPEVMVIQNPGMVIPTAEELLLTVAEMREIDMILLDAAMTVRVGVGAAAAFTLATVAAVYLVSRLLIMQNNRQEDPDTKKKVRLSACASVCHHIVLGAKESFLEGYAVGRALETRYEKRVQRNYRSRK